MRSTCDYFKTHIVHVSSPIHNNIGGLFFFHLIMKINISLTIGFKSLIVSYSPFPSSIHIASPLMVNCWELTLCWTDWYLVVVFKGNYIYIYTHTHIYIYILYKLEFLLYPNLSVYVCETPSWKLEP